MKNSFTTHFLRQGLAVILLAALFFACNKDEEITEPEGVKPPVISLDNSSALYSVKIEKPFTILPEVTNEEDAVFSWKLDGQIISTEKELTYTLYEAGEYILSFRADNRAGSDEVEIRVDASDKALPLISFIEPTNGFELVAGTDYLFSPDVQNAENAVFSWILDGVEVSTEATYTFHSATLGNYLLVFRAENEDGSDEISLLVNVVETIPARIVFPASYLEADPSVKSVAVDRRLYLRPFVENMTAPAFSWFVDDVLQEGATGKLFVFEPVEAGRTHTVRVVATEQQSTQATQINRNLTRSAGSSIEYVLRIETYDKEQTLSRSTTGSKKWNKVYEFLPAPGQFINNSVAGFTHTITTMEEANAFAEERLSNRIHVSLGGFGGSIIAGFDHSIPNKGSKNGYDFSILGNSFEGSSEPGIVWVMQDTNGNGLPDDEWYELKGSEYGKEETIQEYYATYTRPSVPGLPIYWKDNQGNYGAIEVGYYNHDFYPTWVKEDQYTLYGTCLKHKTSLVNGLWVNGSFDWGYADNVGMDILEDGNNHFRISDAVHLDGSPANLQFIDFVKVQTGVNVTAGILGEVSTEVFDFTDENL
ncbi:MAG: cell surface protein [Tannerellaceae bacterium]|nr:cell surface protein [Tannerellaceae bacterium]